MTKQAANKISYDQFRTEWLAELDDPNLSPLEKGRRFGAKLVTQWLGVTTDDDNLVFCDGSGDGGIDIAYLHRADTDTGSGDSDSIEGDTWYLIQSKYGTAFTGADTILADGQKVIHTLQGQNQNLSNDTRSLLDKLDSFKKQTSSYDRIVLVFVTTDPIEYQDRTAIATIRTHGREHVAENFDVEEVSLQTIWDALDDVDPPRLSVCIDGQFVEQSSGLLVGTVSLLDLFSFMRSYQEQTGNLTQTYERNVRQFLGGRKKINRGIANTLNEEPEKFGLYNNGITIVVSGYSRLEHGIVTIRDPYIVNGCQTTRTIWEVLDGRLNAGGTGSDSSLDEWKERVRRGGIVTKIVRSDEAEIASITRYTNSQNAVRERDFIALNEGFQGWASEMGSSYQIFVEIQRGGIEARKAWEKQHPDQPKYSDYVNAFDLIKVYGAGWMEAPGLAFGKNAPFLPNGSVYSRTIDRQSEEPPFGTRDLYAAYKIKCLADSGGFGRRATHGSRRQSRYLFYYLIMRMLKNVILLTPELKRPAVMAGDLTDAVLKLSSLETGDPLEQLSKWALNLVDQYLTQGAERSAFTEDSFSQVHNGDLNAFLRAEDLGKEIHSPKLMQSLAVTNEAFGMSEGRKIVARALIAR